MTKQLDIVLHSDHPPESCLSKLAEEMDVDERTIFSLSGYKGHGSILGRIAGNEFRLHKRRRGHNSFAPILFGRILSDTQGTVIEAHWNTWSWTRIFMRAWLLLAVAMGTPIFIFALLEVMAKGFATTDGGWVGLVMPPALFGWLLPRMGATIAAPEKEFLVEFLEQTLTAGQSPRPSLERTGESQLEDGWG